MPSRSLSAFFARGKSAGNRPSFYAVKATEASAEPEPVSAAPAGETLDGGEKDRSGLEHHDPTPGGTGRPRRDLGSAPGEFDVGEGPLGVDGHGGGEFTEAGLAERAALKAEIASGHDPVGVHVDHLAARTGGGPVDDEQEVLAAHGDGHHADDCITRSAWAAASAVFERSNRAWLSRD